MRAGLRVVLVGVLAAGLSACERGRAIDELRGKVVFYAWTHGSTLSDRPEEVAELTDRTVRSLREIEDFAGFLDAWTERTGAVERIRVGPADYALERNIYFYYLASLRRPAVAPTLHLQITRSGPDGEEVMDLLTSQAAQVNRRAQSGGLLYSMVDLPAGEHRLHLEVLDGDEIAARGDLWVEYDPEGDGS